MKLWMISQSENGGWNTYDSAVVAAETEAFAKNINPSSGSDGISVDQYDGWANSVDAVDCRYIGEAEDGTQAGVILASYNAS